MLILDFSAEEYDGGNIEKILDQVGISVSKSLIPHDPRPAFRPSGLRIGTPAMTTRGIKEQNAIEIADFIHQAIQNRNDSAKLQLLKKEIQNFALRFPLPH